MTALILSIIAYCFLSGGQLPGFAGVMMLGLAPILSILAICFGSWEYITKQDSKQRWKALAGILIAIVTEMQNALLLITYHQNIWEGFLE